MESSRKYDGEARVPINQRSHCSNSVSKVISNMKVTNPIKKLVSQHRKRYIEDGYNLDLTYILSNLIAMGYPAEKLEGVYRNHIDDVAKFLDEKHKDHYKIYNLCAERTYDTAKFHQMVAYYPFDDHNPPCMEVIKPFCEDVHNWLTRDERNVAAIHCKAGKGRTGVMVSCYMLHNRKFDNANDALSFYGQMRTTDKKGVTIPSQKRFVNYYAVLVQENLQYNPVRLYVREICFEPMPFIFATTQGSIQFVISECKRVGEYLIKAKKLHTSVLYDIKKGATSFRVQILTDVPVQGNVKVEFFKHKHKKEKLFHFWFNTFFVREILTPDTPTNNTEQRKSMFLDRSMRTSSYDEQAANNAHINNNKQRAHSVGDVESQSKLVILKINKNELDDAHKDKQHKIFASDFKVSLLMEQVPKECESKDGESTPTGLETSVSTPSESSEAESSTESSIAEDEEEAWESVGEDVDLLGVGRYQILRADADNDVTEH